MTEPPIPVYAEIDRDELGEATGAFSQAIADIVHHEIGDGWDFYDRTDLTDLTDLTGEMVRFEHRLDQMSETIKRGRQSLLRVRMLGAVRAIWERALVREHLLGETQDLVPLIDELARLHTTGLQEQQARTHHRVRDWVYDLADRAATTDDEEEHERLEAAAERVLNEVVRAAWAAASPAPDPHRLVDSKGRSWEREEDGYRWRWGEVPRTCGELEATGAKPAGPAPRQEVHHIQQALAALSSDAATATAHAALLRAQEQLSRSYYSYSWGGARRLLAGHPACWQAEHLARWSHTPEGAEGSIDQEIADQVATTLVRWVVGPQVAYPEDIHAALLHRDD